MATIDEIKQQAEAVKNATQVGENTAERVGGALAGLADITEMQDSKLSDLSHTLRGLKPMFSKIDDVENGLVFRNCAFINVHDAKGVGIEADITIDTSKEMAQYWLSSTEGEYTPFYINNLNNDNRQAYYVISDDAFDWTILKKKRLQRLTFYCMHKATCVLVSLLMQLKNTTVICKIKTCRRQWMKYQEQ